jgi:hypothetical protein
MGLSELSESSRLGGADQFDGRNEHGLEKSGVSPRTEG